MSLLAEPPPTFSTTFPQLLFVAIVAVMVTVTECYTGTPVKGNALKYVSANH